MRGARLGYWMALGIAVLFLFAAWSAPARAEFRTTPEALPYLILVPKPPAAPAAPAGTCKPKPLPEEINVMCSEEPLGAGHPNARLMICVPRKGAPFTVIRVLQRETGV